LIIIFIKRLVVPFNQVLISRFKMSAVVSTTPVVASPVQVSECNALNLNPSGSEKKVRMPTSLPAKYGKFIQFGYFLMNKLNYVGDEFVGEDGEVPPPVVDEKVFLDKLMVFESLENQQAFVQEFFDSSKNINQGLRKMVQIHKRELAKADKPKKEKKVKADKPDKPDKEPKEKKGKAKKVKVATTEDQLVNELVQLATNDEPSSKKDSAKAAVAQLIAEVAPIGDKVKVPKKKVVAEKKTTPLLPPSPVKATSPKATSPKLPVKEKKQPKDKAQKNKKQPTQTPSDNTQQPQQPQPQDEEEEEELNVSVFEHNGIKYLIDDQQNVYDFNTQLPIATFINQSLSFH